MNSLRRLWAITQKELRQLARDRLTFGMVVMIPARLDHPVSMRKKSCSKLQNGYRAKLTTHLECVQ